MKRSLSYSFPDRFYKLIPFGDTKNTDDNWLAGIALRDAMRSLNDRERRIIRLRFFEGRTQMEVAREIHLSPNKRKEDSGPFLTI